MHVNGCHSAAFTMSAPPSSVGSTSHSSTAADRQRPDAEKEKVTLSFEAAMLAAQEQTSAAAGMTIEEESAVNWASSAKGVYHATGPDGRQWTRLELDEVLTPHDKMLVGWPATSDSSAMEAALFIAMDRADGYLKGEVTKEYLLGNKPNIPSLAERSQAIEQRTIAAMSERLG